MNKLWIILVVIILIIFIAYIYLTKYNENFSSTPIKRGKPKMMKVVCPPGYNKEGAMCYQQCKTPHFYGRGEYCMGECSQLYGPGYMNDGKTCRKYTPSKIKYGEKYKSIGAVKPRPIYPRRTGFAGERCPCGYNYNGSYSGGLCYPECPKGYYGTKTFCWANSNKKVDPPYPVRKYWI